MDWLDIGEDHDEDSWGIYYVAAYNFKDEPLEESWPVCAQGYEEAMNIYQLLLQMKR